MANELEQLVLKKAQAWLDGHYDEATKKQVKYLIDNDMKELTESFYKDLEFGTGGLRGIMGVGTNRMNVYTVGLLHRGFRTISRRTSRASRSGLRSATTAATIRACSPSMWQTFSPRTDSPFSCSIRCARRPS